MEIKKEDRLIIAKAGVLIALGLILEYFFLMIPRMPQGGKFISPGMITLIVFSLLYGWKWGMLAGAAFGLIYYQLDPFCVHPAQFVLDYPLAFALTGVAGFFSGGSRLKMYAGIVIANIARFFAHVASGIIFFKYFAKDVSNPLAYSLGYNASFMIPTAVVCLILIPLVYDVLKKMK